LHNEVKKDIMKSRLQKSTADDDVPRMYSNWWETLVKN